METEFLILNYPNPGSFKPSCLSLVISRWIRIQTSKPRWNVASSKDHFFTANPSHSQAELITSILCFHGSSLSVHLPKHLPWCIEITCPPSTPRGWIFRADRAALVSCTVPGIWWVLNSWLSSEENKAREKHRLLMPEICFFSTQMIRPQVLIMETRKAFSMTTARWLTKHLLH